MLVATTGRSPRSIYSGLWLLCQLMGLLSVILIFVLFNGKPFPGGYNWKTTPFSYHPSLMTVGLLFCYGNGILLYRTILGTQKLIMKVFHALFLVVSLTFAAVGLAAIIRNKNISQPPRPHFMSFHSWIGLITLILFVFQWICGFVSFLYPKLSIEARRRYMPSHRLWGKAIFMSAVGSIISGLSQYGQSNVYFTDNDARQKERFMLIFFGLFTSVFAFLVIYLLSNPEFQRPPDENSNK